ncbi:MAG TPA: hypothetical protein EYO93_04225 [Nitrososphaerales archaeon]|nr:hypothetical protein [Nitrososphaerales archaeon]
MKNKIIKKGFRLVPTILITSLSLTGVLVGIYLHEAIDNPASIIIPFILPVIGLIIAVLLTMKLARIINY